MLVLARRVSVLALAFASSLPGCTSDGPRGGSPRPLSFVSETQAEGPVVFMRERPGLLPNRLRVEVIASGAGDLHGAALRITWHPEVLTFVGAEIGETWSKSALALAKEGTPGQLAIAWSEKGEVGIDASTPVTLGSLLFESRSRNGTSIAFKSERSSVVDKKGATVNVAWRGGAIPSR